MFKTHMHGLSLFISDIRNCKSKEAEIKRINKELANIRSKFAVNKVLEGKKKKKYICKLIFIFLLGHNFDFGYMEAVNLLTSGKYSEKFIGYLFLSIVMNEKSNLMRLVIRSLEIDLISINPYHQNLALKYIANMANRDIAKTLGERVLHFLFSGDRMDTVKQSAVLCLLTLFKIKPDIIPEKEYPERIVSFLTDQHLGVITSAVSLIEELAKAGRLNGKNCMSIAICRLNRLMRSPCMDLQDYNYYFVCAPWLCVKLLRLLKYFDFPTEPTLRSRLTESIEIIFNKIQEPPKTRKMEHRISKHALLFEAISLLHRMKMAPSLYIRASSILDMCLKQRESNLRYLSLEAMTLLSECDVSRERIKEQLKPIIDSLNYETDECIRQKAADLLCVLCDKNNFKEIVAEMVEYLETGSVSVREETILKISLLSEKYFDDPMWYVDTILNLLYLGGEFVTEEVWYRFIQIVVNNSTVQGYAAKRVFETVQIGKCNENLIILAAYILGEFGNLIAGDNRSSPFVQLNLLHSKFHISTRKTRALLLTTYVKFANLFPEIKDDVKNIFQSNANSPYTEIQQRAVEYLSLCNIANVDYLATILDEIPCFKRGTSVIENALCRLKSRTSQKHEEETPFKSKTSLLSRSSSVSETYNALHNEHIKDAIIEKTPPLPQTNVLLSDFDILVDVFNKVKYPNENPICRSMSTSFKSSTSEALIELIWHRSGILYENNILRVFTESQFYLHEGRIRFKYQNKTPHAFIGFLAHFPFQNNLQRWTYLVEPCSTTINPKAEIEQEIKVESLQDFSYTPCMSLTFLWTDSHQSIPIQIPMTLNKFIEPVIMSSEDFVLRWNNSILHKLEVVKTFPAKYFIDKNLLVKKLHGFGFGILEKIDPNPENYVCSGVFHSRSSKVGILLRLQPHHQTYAYQLTVRASKKEVAEEVDRLVQLII